MAIAASGTSDRSTGYDIDGDGSTDTFGGVAQDMVDYLAWGQTDTGYGRGGWGYQAYDDSGSWSDNSNTGYVVLGLGFANSEFGITSPSFVINEHTIYTNYIQCDPGDSGWSLTENGGSGYTSSCNWVNLLKTGNLLYELKMVGKPISDTRVVNATDYIKRHWNDTNQDPGWKNGSITSNYQAAYTLMKGLEVYNIKKLDGMDWFDDMSTEIINEQYADGHWEGSNWGNPILDTSWALLTIEKAVEPPQPEPVPALPPIGLIALAGSLGLIAVVMIRRH